MFKRNSGLNRRNMNRKPKVCNLKQLNTELQNERNQRKNSSEELEIVVKDSTD
jgi:hypothetical protein